MASMTSSRRDVFEACAVWEKRFLINEVDSFGHIGQYRYSSGCWMTSYGFLKPCYIFIDKVWTIIMTSSLLLPGSEKCIVKIDGLKGRCFDRSDRKCLSFWTWSIDVTWYQINYEKKYINNSFFLSLNGIFKT